jgi:hypothetical protein
MAAPNPLIIFIQLTLEHSFCWHIVAKATLGRNDGDAALFQ